MAVDYEEGRRLLAEWNAVRTPRGLTSDENEWAMAALSRFMLAHAEALLNPDPWRPIEEADDSEFLLYFPKTLGRNPQPAMFRVGRKRDFPFRPPTHFREIKGPGQ